MRWMTNNGSGECNEPRNHNGQTLNGQTLNNTI